MAVLIKNAALHLREQLAEGQRPIGDGERGARARHHAARDHEEEGRDGYKSGVCAQRHISFWQGRSEGTSRSSGPGGCIHRVRGKRSGLFRSCKKEEGSWWSIPGYWTPMGCWALFSLGRCSKPG